LRRKSTWGKRKHFGAGPGKSVNGKAPFFWKKKAVYGKENYCCFTPKEATFANKGIVYSLAPAF
jgi:hypothetical protein